MAQSKRKFITVDKLGKLGFERLAEIVVEHADEDPALRKKLRLALAANTGPTALTTEVDGRIRSLDRGRSFLDHKQSRALAGELDDLRTAIADRLATVSTLEAADRLQRLAACAPSVLRREAESSGYIEEAFERCCQFNANQSPKHPKGRRSGRQLTPLGQGDGAVLLEDIPAVEVAILIEAVVY